jgi:hypothetical protein
MPTPARRWPYFLAAALLLPLALFAAYVWVTLTWSYSEGERAGYVQKFSRKGWVCKTWEGELAMVNLPGAMAEKFTFSVRDPAVADQVEKSMGKRVSLVYEEHLGVPTSCFAETNHYVVGVRVVAE